MIANPRLSGVMGLGVNVQEEEEKSHIEEMLDADALQGRVSTLATEESKDLYWSYFSKVCACSLVGSVGEILVESNPAHTNEIEGTNRPTRSPDLFTPTGFL